MNQLRAVNANTATLFHARVNAADGERFGVACGAGRFWASAAAGCLLRPCVGDMVLVTLSGNAAYVLMVLERGEDARNELRFVGDTRMVVVDGQLALSAEQGVTLDAGPSLEVRADTAFVEAAQGYVQCEALTVSGDTSRALWRETSVVAEHSFVTVARAETQLGESLRSVAGHDERCAGSVREEVAEDWSLEARDASLAAQRRVSVSADEQIQLG